MGIKILRQDKNAQPPRLRTAVIFGLLFCCMGLYYVAADALWGLGLLYVASGLAAFLHLKTGRLLMVCSSCVLLVVFWADESFLYRCCKDEFFSSVNLLEMVISTGLYAFIVYYFMLPRVREVFARQ